MEMILTLAALTGLIIALFFLARIFKSRSNCSYSQIQTRVEKINQQAQVIIPQAADYPGSLGKEGALMIHDINSGISRLNGVLNEISEFGLDSDNSETLKSFDFQQDLLKCEKLLKSLGKMLAQASKRASAINLPKAHKNKSTIDSLEEVGLIDKEDCFGKM